jgi:SAM-dependent methyltransferase
MRAAFVRRWLARFRYWPIHPQWLLATSGERDDLRDALSRMHGSVLDIGCTDRRLAALLPESCHYVGLDYPPTASGMYGTRPDVFSDARTLPFAEASIDGVILKDVLEHVEGPEEALREIARILGNGGKLVLWMPYLYPIHDAPYDFQRYTEHGLASYLGKHGLDVVGIKPVLRPVETAALLTALALADAAEQIILRRKSFVVLLPLLAIGVFSANLWGKAMSWLPHSRFMPALYRVDACRRSRELQR